MALIEVTFVLSSGRIVIRLLVDLAIDLKQFLICNLPKVMQYHHKSYSHTFSIGISQPKFAQ